MNDMEILAIVAFVLAAVCVVWGIVKTVQGNKWCCAADSCAAAYLYMGAVLFGMVGLLMGIWSDGLDALEAHEEMICEIEENAENWTFFLDGQEVSFDTIDLDQYDVSYDAEQNKVFLTKKQGSGSSIVPIFIPRL